MARRARSQAPTPTGEPVQPGVSSRIWKVSGLVVSVLLGLAGFCQFYVGAQSLNDFLVATRLSELQAYLTDLPAKSRNQNTKCGPVCSDFRLRNEDGQYVRLNSGRSKLVLITQGSLRSKCIGWAEDLSILRDALAPALDIETYYIGLDSDVDTPSTLKAFKARYQLSTHFLAGSEKEIAYAAKRLRIYYQINGPSDQFPIDYSTAIYMFDGRGRFMTVLPQGDTRGGIERVFKTLDEEAARRVGARVALSDSEYPRLFRIASDISGNADPRIAAATVRAEARSRDLKVPHCDH